jgi:hypothetical protein
MELKSEVDFNVKRYKEEKVRGMGKSDEGGKTRAGIDIA